MMKNKGKEVFFLEYTKSEAIVDQIESYCKHEHYRYYISTNTFNNQSLCYINTLMLSLNQNCLTKMIIFKRCSYFYITTDNIW